MLKSVIASAAIVLAVSSCGLLQSQKSLPVPVPTSKIETHQSVGEQIKKLWTDSASVLCHVQSLYYEPSLKTLFLLQANPLEKDQQNYISLYYDLKSKQYTRLSSTPIKAQNNLQVQDEVRFKELIEKGKKPRYKVHEFRDLVYDASNKNLILLNAGRVSRLDKKYSTEPSIHTLSEDNRLLGQYAISRLFKPIDNVEADALAFQIMAISPSTNKLFTATSYPLKSEKPSVDSYDTGFVRISRYRTSSRSEECQYLYPLSLPNDAGVLKLSDNDLYIVNMLALNDSVLWVIEGLDTREGYTSYRVYEVVLEDDKKLSSNKPIKELRKRPYVHKTFKYDLTPMVSDGDLKIKDWTWGPVVDKKPSVYLLMIGACDAGANEIIQVVFSQK